MNESQDKIKFWTFIVAGILVVSIAVLMIDMTIKAGILAEADSLRDFIARERDGQTKGNANRVGDYPSDSIGVLSRSGTGVENKPVDKAGKSEIGRLSDFPAKARGTSANNGTKRNPRQIPSGSEQVES